MGRVLVVGAKVWSRSGCFTVVQCKAWCLFGASSFQRAMLAGVLLSSNCSSMERLLSISMVSRVSSVAERGSGLAGNGVGDWVGRVGSGSGCCVAVSSSSCVECWAALSMLQWTCRLRSTGSHLGAVVRVIICVGGFGWKSAWCSGREGIGIIVVDIGSPSSEYRSSIIRCLKASTVVRTSGEMSVSVEVLEEVRWV